MDKNMEHDMETAVMLRVLLFCMRFVVSVVLDKQMWFCLGTKPRQNRVCRDI